MITGKRYKLGPVSKSLVALAVLLVVQLFISADKHSLSTIYAQTLPHVSIIGHRGAAGLAPENTLAAFEKACQIGVSAIELDVLLTADGNIIVHHDYTLSPEIARTADGQWLGRPGPAIKDSTLAQLKTYDVGRLKPDTRYARRYPDQLPSDGERIPTLSEVIELVNRKCSEETQLWVEIKTNPEKPGLTLPPEPIAEAVVARLREQNYSPRTRILAFDWQVLVHVQKIAPEIPTVYLSHAGSRLNTIKAGQPGSSPWLAGLDIDDFNGSIPRAVKAAGGKHWSPHYKYITYALLEEAYQLGLGVYVWTVDSRSEMVRLIEMGVDGITTNRPDLLRSVLESP
jgi:glycerophosphoryl diester phosphodiesterase